MTERVTPGDNIRDEMKATAMLRSKGDYRPPAGMETIERFSEGFDAGWDARSRVSPVTREAELIERIQREMDSYDPETLGDDPAVFDSWNLLHDARAALIASQPVQVEVTDDTFTRMMSSLDRLGRETIAALIAELIAELNEVDADIRGELGTDVASRAASALAAALGGGDHE